MPGREPSDGGIQQLAVYCNISKLQKTNGTHFLMTTNHIYVLLNNLHTMQLKNLSKGVFSL